MRTGSHYKDWQPSEVESNQCSRPPRSANYRGRDRSWSFDMDQPTCRICSGTLPPRHRTFCGPDCKAVSEKARSRSRYLADVDGYKQQSRQWKRDHPERTKELARAYGMAHRDETREREASYRATHRDRYSGHGRNWYWRDPARSREAGRNNASSRRAKVAKSGSFSVRAVDYTRTLARYRNACAYCQGPFTASNALQWDHVLPIKLGGRHSIGNLLPACRRCNQSKQGKLLAVWRAKAAVVL